jgi:hypothetical protein
VVLGFGCAFGPGDAGRVGGAARGGTGTGAGEPCRNSVVYIRIGICSQTTLADAGRLRSDMLDHGLEDDCNEDST